MKKILLMAAFAGLLGSTIVARTSGDDKDKKKKECCKKGEGKACAGEKGTASGEKKSCCKSKAEVAETKTGTEKK